METYSRRSTMSVTVERLSPARVTLTPPSRSAVRAAALPRADSGMKTSY
jgi:hypothetical protein